MKKIVFTRPDGGTSVVIPAPKINLEKIFGTLTDEEYEKHVWSRSVPADAINAKYVNEDAIPKSREFRDAWVQNGSTIEHDLEKARGIQLARVRAARDKKLTLLDKDHIDALASGSDASSIMAEKQKMLDITESLKTMKPKSIDDIAKAFPPELKNIDDSIDITATSGQVLGKIFNKLSDADSKVNAVQALAQKVDNDHKVSLPLLDQLNAETKDIISPKVDGIDTKTKDLDTKTKTLETTAAGLDTKTKNLETLATSLDAKTKTLETTSATLTTRSQTLDGQIVINTGDIATLKSDVATLKSDVATLKTQVAGHTADIAAIKTFVKYVPPKT